MRNNLLLIGALFFLSVGFFASWWVLSLVGLVMVLYAGRPLLGVLIGVVLDLIYGVPVGWLHFLYIPFTLCACALTLASRGLPYYVRKRPPTRLL